MNHTIIMSLGTMRNNSTTIEQTIMITANFTTTIIMNPMYNTKRHPTIKKHIRYTVYFPHGGKGRTSTETLYPIRMHPFLRPLVAVLLIPASMLT
jgi:hypothetical protein